MNDVEVGCRVRVLDTDNMRVLGHVGKEFVVSQIQGNYVFGTKTTVNYGVYARDT